MCLQLGAGERVRVSAAGATALLPLAFDATIPEGCVRIARGIPETAALGEGAIAVEKATESAAA